MATTLAQCFLAILALISYFGPPFVNALSVNFPRHINQLAARAVAIPNPPAAGWKSLGCYTEGTGHRALQDGGYVSNTLMTIEACIAYCSAKGSYYAGVEYSAECYCGSSLSTGAVPAPITDCGMTCSGAPNEPCGGPARLNLFSSTAPPPAPPQINPGPQGWGSLGCYNEGTLGRALPNGVATTGGAAALTVALCTTACASQNYLYAGVEYSGECYCANAITNGGFPAINGCDMICNGNSSEFCGGPSKLNVYQFGAVAVSSSTSSTTTAASTTTSATTTAASPGQSGWSSMGCYAEGTTGRTLPNGIGVAGLMTVEGCQVACLAAGYTLAGVEYSQECWCGNSFINGGVPAPDGNTGCNMACKGNAGEMCGGPNRLNVYVYGTATTPTTSVSASSTSSTSSSSTSATSSGWINIGCYTDPGPRSLVNQITLPNAMTVELCQTACASKGYTLAGVEYGGECFCDTQIRNQGVPAASGCTMPCNGNAAEICGGPNRLNVYQLGGSPPSSTSQSTTSTTTSAAGSASTLLPGWTYGGCYVDANNAGRIVAKQQPDSPTLTIESCVATCAGLGYVVAGMEFSSQCFCDSVVRFGAPVAPDTDCGMACSGAGTEKCGGPNRMSIYSKGPLIVNQAPAAQTGGLPGSWKYVGCIKDLMDNKYILPNQLIQPDTNGPLTCLSQCSKFGFGAGGMEYGQECYCGDPVPSPIMMPETDCVITCPGNSTALCGGGARLSYYEWKGDSLAAFNYPTGAAAGKYQFLIGGVVVPLITTVNINGKVMFLEKHGTGAPNTTGAYEFDPFFDNDFTNAWRELKGLRTDVFCSAGLVLPDKKGRMLTIGGWSDVSTTGVRLYTPSGSNGVPGTTDWEENANEIALQVGRWYPSAVMLANGTILVVGGERGSNDAAQASLELLPRVGPVLPMDWLQRTDPYNLYPFLAVLPSGGVFVAYYNEARILDPNTFATTRELPALPAGVTSPKGGRTYPLEGTMMILPQYAPYTDPLRVIICGGSTPFAGVAIDNCASIAPDNTTDDWLIERMPSKRVMSCMTALPDGTYLIINGAMQGVAGFGLAVNPNFNAVLYDPSKEKHHRMSVMDNTTIARLYHSEAVLMPDGRVLVSGSDPQDAIHPEEYRVEVFLPPYLTSGAPRPSFQFVSISDVAYGGQFQVQITAGNVANIKFSLMGAESSTHGSTMGQRSIFPAFTCAGQVCTITAPPNANICPPGWFQLFALDNGIPSHSRFIRIGGDPSSLGNWPNLPDFTLPGV